MEWQDVNLRDTAHDGMNIMHKLQDRSDWIAPFPGREHHAKWCAAVTHPDMKLIAAAPDLLEALREGRRAIGEHFAPNDCYATGPVTGDPIRDLVQCPACSFIGMFDAAIAKATGASDE